MMDEDDEDGDSQEGASHAGACCLSPAVVANRESSVLTTLRTDRVSKPVLKALIEKLATRTNYGLEVSDLPDGLPEGVTEVPSVSWSNTSSFEPQLTTSSRPQSLQIWVWEINDSKLLPTEREKKLEARKTERVEVRVSANTLCLTARSRSVPSCPLHR